MRHPALALACPFVAGLAAGGSRPAAAGLATLLACAGLGTLVLACTTRRSATWRWAAWALIAVGAGAVWGARDGALRHAPPLRAALAAHLEAETPVRIEGVVRGDAQPGREDGASFVIDRVSVAGTRVATRGPAGIRVNVGGRPAAASIAEWHEGVTVSFPGFLRAPGIYRDPGVPDFAVALARRDVALLGSAKSAALVTVSVAALPADRAAAGVRRWVRQTLATYLAGAPRATAIAVAILIGDRTGLDEETNDRLRRAGTFHVIAISGGNVALFTVATVIVLRILRVRPRVAAVVAIATLLAFGAVVERGASVDRALTVAIAYLVAQVMDHRASPLNVMGATALGSGLLHPAIVFDVGAHLTFGATAGLLIGTHRARAWLATLSRGPGAAGWTTGPCRVMVDAVSATLAAEAAVVPISAFAFGQVTIAGLVLNLIAIPAMTVVQFGGMTVLAASGLAPGMATRAAAATTAAADVLVDSADLVEWCPWMVIDTAWASAMMDEPARHPLPPRAAARYAGRLLTVTFLDVGQGDATLVQFPSGRSLLFDAGGAAGTTFDIGRRVIAPAVRALGTPRLSWLAVSHGDPDHVSGAAAVIGALHPDEVWQGVPVPRAPELESFLAAARASGVPSRDVVASDRLRVDDVEVDVLHPPLPDWERQRVRNDDSIVLAIRFGDVTIVLPGDISEAIERDVLARLARGRIVIVKAAHHGSRTSSGPAWVDALRPDAVVFSVGRGNRFGHPAPDVVARYVAARSTVFRTDRDGAITMATNGDAVWAVTMEGRRWWTTGSFDSR